MLCVPVPEWLDRWQRWTLPRWWCNLLLQTSLSPSSFPSPQGSPSALRTLWSTGRVSEAPTHTWWVKRTKCWVQLIKKHTNLLCRVISTQVCYLLSCFLFRSESCMSLLPQELSCPQERLRVFELPSLRGGEKKKKDFRVMVFQFQFPSLSMSLQRPKSKRYGTGNCKRRSCWYWPQHCTTGWVWLAGLCGTAPILRRLGTSLEQKHKTNTTVNIKYHRQTAIEIYAAARTCLTGRSDRNGLCQLGLSWPGYPGNLTKRRTAPWNDRHFVMFCPSYFISNI